MNAQIYEQIYSNKRKHDYRLITCTTRRCALVDSTKEEGYSYNVTALDQERVSALEWVLRMDSGSWGLGLEVMHAVP